ncbi:MCP four helix bundle domain-containing protein [Pseudoduganella namucuonensis]|uniref:Methyl-accepting chemotaxis protein n=1 Tax=Pseudoduganella namucuonensis TaxID=1035707 RepID=A0A1I7KWR4_9BURK|nr:MCP four helix bundle domain-containing protein [Pseudoduganella namucuonensis]SFV01875.1 methyl-accepting chemotaxis protein [Pseudoduganella namucuonensis]
MAIANLRVGTRLATGLGLVLAMLVLVSAQGMDGMAGINERLQRIVGFNVERLLMVQEMSEAVHVEARIVRTVVLLNDETAIRAELPRLAEAREQYALASATLNRMPASPEGRRLREAMEQARLAAQSHIDQLVRLALQQRDEDATALLMRHAAPATQRWQDAMNAYAALQKRNNRLDAEAAAQAYAEARALMLALSALAVAAAVAASLLIARAPPRQPAGAAGPAPKRRLPRPARL